MAATETDGGQRCRRNPFRPEHLNGKKVLVTALGVFVGIGLLAYLSYASVAPLLITSFGATAVLLYAVPESPLAQPKNVFFGHLFSAIVGCVFCMLFGVTWLTVTLAVTLAIVLMVVTNTTHPPGGATALVCAQSAISPVFIFMPVMLGISFMLVVWYFTFRLRKKCDAPAQAKV